MKKFIGRFSFVMNSITIKEYIFYIFASLFVVAINFLGIAHDLLQMRGFTDLLKDLTSFGWFVYVFSILGLSLQLSKFISIRDLIKLSISYVIYLFISYFLFATININNPAFKIEKLTENDFYEFRFLPLLLIIVGLSFLLKYLLRALGAHRKSQRYLPEHESNHFILAGLIGSMAVQDSKLLDQIKDNLGPFLTEQQIPQFLMLLANLIFIASLAFVFLANATLNGLRDLRYNRPSINLVISTSILFAVIFNYTLQLGVQEKVDLLGYHLFPGASFFQILILFLLSVVMYSLINQYFSATILIIGLGTVLSIANSIKMSMRNEPLLLTDFVWIKELHLVISFVDKHLFNYLLLLLVSVIILAYVLRKRIVPGKIYSHWQKQFAVLAAISVFFLGVFQVFRLEKDNKILEGIPIISKLNNRFNVDWLGFATTARYKSVTYIWMKQLTNPVMEKPSDYSSEAIEALVERYRKLALQMNEEREQFISDQTVIYILSESLSDPTRVPGVTLSTDVLANIKAVKEKTTSGLMQSDGYGGGTANMEFQTLTGLPFYNFSPTVSTLYSEVVPKMSIFPSISNAFKASNRYVLHPSGAGNYNRYNIYQSLDFEDLVFLEGSEDVFSDIQTRGVGVSDETVYNNVLQRLKTDQSQFFSIITMQNHAPWSVGNPVEITASGEGFSDKENGTLTEYVRLMSYTDQATKEFLEALSKLDKKITVVFYGDHLPGFYPEKTFASYSEVQYQTDYFIWSNWQTKKLDYPLINSSDFSAALLAHTDSKVSPYYALLTEVLNKASVNHISETNDQEQIAHDLRLLQYDITVGKGYLTAYEDFFSIPKP